MRSGNLPTLREIKSLMTKVAREHGIAEQAANTWRHSTVVWRFAQKIARLAERHGYSVDFKLLKVGCYVHDVGRMVTGSKGSKILQAGIYHFYEGYKIMKKWGYPQLARICVCHACGGGLSKKTNKRFGFIARDFFPKSIEEKIIAYADARTSYQKGKGPVIWSMASAYRRFKKYEGAGARLLGTHRFIQKITHHQMA